MKTILSVLLMFFLTVACTSADENQTALEKTIEKTTNSTEITTEICLWV